MLNVALVQKHISKEFLKACKNYPDPSKYYPGVAYHDRALINPWNISSLPSTCSAAEISMEWTRKSLALRIAQLLRGNYKYAQCSSVHPKTCKLLEEFGFKKVTDYMGNHRKRVHIYYINLENVKF